MKGDFSRLRFDPAKHYAAVLEQQGRVAVDADGNEATAINDYLRTTTNRDVIGGCGAPKHDSGFHIGLIPASGNGVTDLSISQGRIYVDGILCQLEADGTYLAQVDYPQATFAPVAGQTDLVYLDVWQQHVTAIEDDALRERALGGPDTTTRLRTVCQVKILPNVGADGPVSCSSTIAAWDALRAPTTARLTTEVGAGPADEPCTLAPGGGYTGLENQLYRIEIHESKNGTPGSFKWSRDNGSIVVAATAFPAGDKVEVERLGWDDVRALRKNDWVEILNDVTELQGVPGTMARIADILPGRILQLDRTISGYADAARHPRVRRWDQGGDAVTIPSGPITIEDRIELTFAGADFRCGDYWTFAARVGYGDKAGDIIDKLTTAPPRGIVHHYCKLGLITWSAGSGGAVDGAVTDCRAEFPPLTELPKAASCCTVTVGDGINSVGDYADLQDAIDDVADGGSVCVLPGVYNLNAPLNIANRTGLTISGCGRAARIQAANGSVLTATNSRVLRLQNLFLQAPPTTSALVLGGCSEVGIVGCQVLQGDPEQPLDPTMGPAIIVAAGTSVRIQANYIMGSPAIAVSGEDLSVLDNRMFRGGVWIQEGTHVALVADNAIDGDNAAGAGVTLGGRVDIDQPDSNVTGVAAVRIDGNVIAGMDDGGIITPVVPRVVAGATGVVGATGAAVGAMEPVEIGGVLRPMSGVEMRVGTVSALEPRLVMTRAAGLTAGRVSVEPRRMSVLTAVADIGQGQTEDLTIVNNRIQGCVVNERVGQAAAPLGGVVLRSVARVRMHGNEISGNGAHVPCCGVLVVNGEDLEFVNNRIVDNGTAAWDGAQGAQAGILAYLVQGSGAGALRIHDNVVTCPRGQTLLVLSLGPVSVVGNVLSSLPAPPPGSESKGFLAGAARAGAGVLVWNGGVKTGFADFQSLWSSVTGNTTGEAAGARGADGRVLFQNNQVTIDTSEDSPGPVGLRTAVNLLSFDDIAMSDNQVDVNVRGLTGVMAMGRTVRVSGNAIADQPALGSYLGLAKWHCVTGNQATRCIVALGDQVVDTPNQVMFAEPLIALATCAKAKASFKKYLQSQGFVIGG